MAETTKIPASKVKTNTYSQEELKAFIEQESSRWQGVKAEIRKAVVGQGHIIDRTIIGLLCNGHILLEGVPGIAKTTLIKTISKIIGLSFQRIQFTPDLLPADVIGTLIYDPKTQSFQTKKGPIFNNIILADEINRAPAKVQSALLEAMQEHQVTIGEATHPLDQPFLVLATQNPIEQEGTYHLPEAQVDRFIFKLIMTYPTQQEEKSVINKVFCPETIHCLISQEDICNAQSVISQIYIDEKVVDYILNIIFATRTPNNQSLEELKHLIEYGASPRATLALHHAARAHAFLQKRHFVIPDDVKAVAPDVLRHRILLTYEAEAENITSSQILEKILSAVPSP